MSKRTGRVERAARANARRSSASSPARRARAAPTPTNFSTNWPGSRARPAPRSSSRRRRSARRRIPATLIGARQGRMARRGLRARPNASVIIFDNDLTPAQARNLETALRPPRHRSHRADPRHLRAARADARRPAPGRARAAAVPAAAAGRIERRAVAPRRRHRHPGPWRNQARNRSPAHPSSDAGAEGARSRWSRRRRGYLRDRRKRTDVPTVALVGYTNAGKTTLFNLLTGAAATGVARAVRHARSADAAREARRRAADAAVGYRRIHRPAAAPARRGVSRDARRGGVGRSARCT